MPPASRRAEPAERREPGPNEARARREAFAWQVTLWSGEVTAAEERDFDSWLRADPRHALAWQQIQRVGQHLQAIPAAVASPVLKASLASRGRRRGVLRSVAGLAAVGLAAWGVRETPQWRAASADLRTARGERRDFVLPDGTQLTLNTATSVDLRFDARERRIVLRSGEILVATAPDHEPHPRSFLVETPEGNVRPLGTRFSVRRLEDASPAAVLVQVAEGAVELAPHGGAAPVRLDAGQKAAFTQLGVAAILPADEAATAWTRGLLVAERMRLAELLGELGRYRSGVLRCDPAVADLLVSGVYPLADTDAVLASLPQALPVRVRWVTRYWVTVAAQ